jgi:hypothetical protein
MMGHGNSIEAARWPAWLNAAALLLLSWIAIAALSLQIRADAEVVAVAFPLWWSTQQAFQAAASANVRIVRTTAIPAVLVVRLGDGAGLTRLREAGAWLAIDPRAVAACLTLEGEGNRG